MGFVEKNFTGLTGDKVLSWVIRHPYLDWVSICSYSKRKSRSNFWDSSDEEIWMCENTAFGVIRCEIIVNTVY